MKPTLATSYLMLACHFLSGALRARRIAGEGLIGLSRLRAANARACFRDWLYHSRKAGAFSAATQAEQPQPTGLPPSPTREELRARNEQRNAEQAIRAMRELLALLPPSAGRADPRLRKLRHELARARPADLPKSVASWAALVATLLKPAVTQLRHLQPDRVRFLAGSSTPPHPSHPHGHAGAASHATEAAPAHDPAGQSSRPSSSQDSAALLAAVQEHLKQPAHSLEALW